MHSAFEGVEDDAFGQFGGLRTVGVRCGLEVNQNIAKLRKSRRDVPVEVEGAGDGNLRPNHCAHLTHQLSLSRAYAFGINGPVQSQKDRIDRHGCAERIEDPRHRLAASGLSGRPAVREMRGHTGHSHQPAFPPRR